jgi:hypothetical protein
MRNRHFAVEEKAIRSKTWKLGERQSQIYFLRCRILARIRRFLRPCLRRPFPDFFVPTGTPKWMV